VKTDERRVALTPDGVREMDAHGVSVLVQAGAGVGASIPDEAYSAAGAEIVATAEEVWGRAGMVVKVKEPQASELDLLRPDLTLFTYLHLAAYPEVAGRLAVQAGARFLEAPQGGRGVLLGGAPGVQPARVVVIGAGNVGWNAAWIAAGMEAEVNLLDKNLDRLRFVDQIHRGRISTLASNRGTVERCIADADLVIGAVLVPGGRAPVVITEDMVKTMKPGAVLVDVAIDQGGCIETSHETSHHDPTFVLHDVVHYCVGNMPGAVPATSTHALTNATLPYLVALAVHGTDEACRLDPTLAAGLNVQGGKVVHAAVAQALGA
jgi:alanine dehydrogenase